MYAFVDRPVAELDQGSRLLVWSMRIWVASMGKRKCPGSALAPAFAGLSVLSGMQPFMTMMALLNRHGLENFQFCDPRCACVSEHEALILSTVCATRDPNPEPLKATLGLLVAEEAVSPVFDALTRLKLALLTAGMHPVEPSQDSTISSNYRR